MDQQQQDTLLELCYEILLSMKVTDVPVCLMPELAHALFMLDSYIANAVHSTPANNVIPFKHKVH